MASLKAKLLAAGAAILGFIALFIRLKVVQSQRDSAREKAAKYKAWSERQQETAIIDAEIDQTFSHRAEVAKEALKNDEIPEHLTRPRALRHR